MCIKIAFWFIPMNEISQRLLVMPDSPDTSAFPTPGLVAYMLPEFQYVQQTS